MCTCASVLLCFNCYVSVILVVFASHAATRSSGWLLPSLAIALSYHRVLLYADNADARARYFYPSAVLV